MTENTTLLAWSADWDCMIFGTLEAAEAYYEAEFDAEMHSRQLEHDRYWDSQSE